MHTWHLTKIHFGIGCITLSVVNFLEISNLSKINSVQKDVALTLFSFSFTYPNLPNYNGIGETNDYIVFFGHPSVHQVKCLQERI
jgi:hypothetical protein